MIEIHDVVEHFENNVTKKIDEDKENGKSLEYLDPNYVYVFADREQLRSGNVAWYLYIGKTKRIADSISFPIEETYVKTVQDLEDCVEPIKKQLISLIKFVTKIDFLFDRSKSFNVGKGRIPDISAKVVTEKV